MHTSRNQFKSILGRERFKTTTHSIHSLEAYYSGHRYPLGQWSDVGRHNNTRIHFQRFLIKVAIPKLVYRGEQRENRIVAVYCDDARIWTTKGLSLRAWERLINRSSYVRTFGFFFCVFHRRRWNRQKSSESYFALELTRVSWRMAAHKSVRRQKGRNKTNQKGWISKKARKDTACLVISVS